MRPRGFTLAMLAMLAALATPALATPALATPALARQQSARTAADSAADSGAAAQAPDDEAVRRRYPRAFGSSGAPLWHAGGVVSSPREAALARTVLEAMPLLVALWWVGLALRAIVLDRRRRTSVIVVVGLLGALIAALAGPVLVSGGLALANDRVGDGKALLGALVVWCALCWAIVDSMAHPTRPGPGGDEPRPVLVGTETPGAPSLDPRTSAALRVLYRWLLAGVALGLLVVGIGYGYSFDTVSPRTPKVAGNTLALLGAAVGLFGALRARQSHPDP